MKKRTWKVISICIGIFFSVALLSALFISRKFSTEIIASLATFVLVILVYYYFFTSKQKRNIIMYDEFTVHQDLKSFRNSWIITVIATSLISNIELLGIYSFQMNTALGVILIVMILSFWISHFIYLKWPKAR